MSGQKIINKEIDSRVIIKLDKTIKKTNAGVNGLMTFGENNDYPQIMEKLINGSPTAKNSANVYSKFLSGQGFENTEINKIVIGKDSRGKNITMQSLLRDASVSISRNMGFYIHCNFKLNGKIKDVHLKSFKNIRFAKPDDRGYTAKLLYYDNWDKMERFDKTKIKEFNVFNLDSEVFAEQVKKAGGITKYKGQIYFGFLDNEYFYPLSNYDEVYLDLDTEAQISLFQNRQLRNGFFKKTILRIQPTGNEEEMAELADTARETLGPGGSGLWIIEDDIKNDGTISETTSFKTEQLDSNIDDKLFENWEKSLSNKIRKSAKGMPAILIDYEENKLGSTSGEAIIQATNFYNAITLDDRTFIEEAFQEIFTNFDNEILSQNTNWKIKPLNLIQQQKDGTNTTF